MLVDNALSTTFEMPTAVSSVALSSATGIQNNLLNAGDVVYATVTMNNATTVTGTPTLGLTIGSTVYQASYVSGSGTTGLVFSYTVLAGQTDTNGISIAANSLALAGGTLTDAGGHAATITHALVADNASYMVDTTAPAAPVMALLNDSGTSSTDGITNVATVNVTGLETGATWQYSADGGSTWTTGTGTSFNLTSGAHSYEVRQTDLAGNLGAASAASSYNLDTTAPALLLNSATPAANFTQMVKQALVLNNPTGNVNNQFAQGPAVSFGGDLTIETWVNPTSYPGADTPMFDIGNGPLNSNLLMGVQSGTAPTLAFYALNGGTTLGSITSSAGALPTGTWSHVAVTIASNGLMTLYVNDVSVGSVTLTALPTDMARTYTFMGRGTFGTDTGWSSSGAYFNGQLSDFRVYDNARTQAQIASDMSGAIDTTDSNLKLAYGYQGSTASAVSGQTAAVLNASYDQAFVGSPTYGIAPGAWMSLDNASNAASTLTDANNIANVKVAISGLLDASNEKLIVGTTAINANGSVSSGSVVESGNTWDWSYSGGSFTFALHGSATGATTAQAQSLVRGMSYQDIAATMSSGSRVFSFTETDMAGNLSSAATSTVATATPLLLDLSGNGIHTVAANHGVLFDVANNGQLSNTGWASSTTGILVRDINNDGVINNGSELFGSGTLLANGSHAANGFDALAQFDANHDGVINAQDAIFSQLKVWVDANGDGVSQASELRSMQDLSIASFNLSATANNTGENGNVNGLVSSYTTTDGAVHQLVDVTFAQGAQTSLTTDAAGLTTLKLMSSSQSLDLTAVATGNLQGVDVIDLSAGGANTLTLDVSKVLSVSGINFVNSGIAGLTGGSYNFATDVSRHQLIVSGDATDSLVTSGGFVDTGLTAIISGHTYEVYNQSTFAQLLVDQSMNRTAVL